MFRILLIVISFSENAAKWFGFDRGEPLVANRMFMLRDFNDEIMQHYESVGANGSLVGIVSHVFDLYCPHCLTTVAGLLGWCS